MATLSDAVEEGIEDAKEKLDNGATMVAIGKTSVPAHLTYSEWKLLFDEKHASLQDQLKDDHGVRIQVIHPKANDAKVFLKFAQALSGRNGSTSPEVDVEIDLPSPPDDA